MLLKGFFFAVTHPLSTRVVGAPLITSTLVSSIFLYSQLLSGTWRTPCLSIPRCCLPTPFSVSLVFFLFSLCRARWFWPDLMNARHIHTNHSRLISYNVSGKFSSRFRLLSTKFVKHQQPLQTVLRRKGTKGERKTLNQGFCFTEYRVVVFYN